ILAGDDKIELAATQRETRVSPGRTDIREKIETLSQHHRWIDFAAGGILELESGGRAEHHPFSPPCLLDDVGVNRTAVSAQAGVTDRGFLNLQSQIKALGNRTEDVKRGGWHFRANAVTGKNKEIHGVNSRNCGGRHHRLFQRKEKGRPRAAL